MKCYNSFCPFRTNDSNDKDNCVCECRPNRVKSEGIYASDKTVISTRGSSNTTEVAVDKISYNFRI